MELKPLTLEQLPAAFSEFLSRFSNVERLLSISSTQAAQPTDNWMSLEELCAYLPGKPAKATVYGLVQQRAIPHKKFGKRLAFLKSEIDSWINSKARKTVTETEASASEYLSKSKRKKTIS